MLSATWANVVEHAADPHDNPLGSRGRGFKSRRPDNINVTPVSASALLRRLTESKSVIIG